MRIALVHEVSERIAECELSFLDRQPVDLALARHQHEQYALALEACGFEVRRLDCNASFPDSCFIEDTAIVLDEVAIIASMGAESRRGETDAIEAELEKYRPTERLCLPATIEGGDVLVIGKEIFAGLSARTNPEGIDALARIAEPLGYTVTAAEVLGCLHLKSAITAISDETVIANPHWVDLEPFRRFRILHTPDREPHAANTLRAGGRLFVAAGFPRTLDLLSRHHLDVAVLDISELRKAEAGLTCSSLFFGR